ncbi:hypothetical protein [Limnobacter sp.]|uniref:hypothetical protein n=1 Tax=Limnobacter sp. TaxID=2003368 RepID=UPI00311EBA59
MTSSWLSGVSSHGAEAFSDAFWRQHRESLSLGQFWADRIKDLQNRPIERLRLAVENIPLPAAFREAAVAVRALIKDKKKAGACFSEELACLYWLAAIQSFSMAYSERLTEPGFNVLQVIPGQIVIGLPFSYRALGHERLALLTKTDRKWIEAAWGGPDMHSTLLDMHRQVWNEYEERLYQRRQSERQQFINEIRDLMK